MLLFDTDSVIYKSSSGEDLLPSDVCLGDLTDELDGHHIVKFVSTGPKKCGYKMENGKCFGKIKGFMLINSVSQMLNFEKMKEEVQLWLKSITRDPIKQKIFNRVESKKYCVVYRKRALNYDTKPYGF